MQPMFHRQEALEVPAVSVSEAAALRSCRPGVLPPAVAAAVWRGIRPISMPNSEAFTRQTLSNAPPISCETTAELVDTASIRPFRISSAINVVTPS